MAKGENQKLKAMYLMKILLDNTDEEHPLTMSEIIEELGRYGISAERKSIYSDIEALRVYGINIETKKDKSVGYYVGERLFETPELKLLVDAVQASKFITRKKSDVLIKKLETLTSKRGAQRLQRQVFVSNRIKNMNESIYYSVDYIHEAISDNVKIRFQYFDWDEKKNKKLRKDGAEYKVSPWALTWDAENYYMIAYESESGKIKHFRVDRMINIKVSDERREGRELFRDFDMARYAKKTFGMFGGEDEYVTLRCKNKMAGIIIDRFGREVTMRKFDEECFDVTVEVAVSTHFITWLMNFGGDVRVVSPQRVIDMYVSSAKEALELYSEK